MTSPALITITQLKARYARSDQDIKGMLDKGGIKPVFEHTSGPKRPPTKFYDEKAAVSRIEAVIAANKAKRQARDSAAPVTAPVAPIDPRVSKNIDYIVGMVEELTEQNKTLLAGNIELNKRLEAVAGRFDRMCAELGVKGGA